jgi:hypothetical protein
LIGPGLCSGGKIGGVPVADQPGSVRFNNPLRPPLRRAPRVAGAGPAWPSFTGKAELVGTSKSGVTVYVDPTLGEPGQQNADELLSMADGVVEQNNTIFAITGGPVDAIVFALNGKTDGTGGADHDGCDFSTGNAIEVDAAFGSPERVIGLFEAELSECAMNGRLCGQSNGEALSRWCAAVVSDNALADFATAPQWAQDGMANWVDQTEGTDTDPDSVGCGMAFISWLISQGHKLPQIAQAMVKLGDAGTLAQLYAQVTGKAASTAWASFKAAVTALPGGVTNDDPFNALGAAR